MVKTGRTIGRFLRKIVTSSEWRTVQKASRELRYLPNRLMREAEIEDLSKDLADLNKIGGEISQEVKSVENDLSSWTTPPELSSPTPDKPLVSSPSSTKPELPSNQDSANNSI
jgi:hypothetical protein